MQFSCLVSTVQAEQLGFFLVTSEILSFCNINLLLCTLVAVVPENYSQEEKLQIPTSPALSHVT